MKSNMQSGLYRDPMGTVKGISADRTFYQYDVDHRGQKTNYRRAFEITPQDYVETKEMASKSSLSLHDRSTLAEGQNIRLQAFGTYLQKQVGITHIPRQARALPAAPAPAPVARIQEVGGQSSMTAPPECPQFTDANIWGPTFTALNPLPPLSGEGLWANTAMAFDDSMMWSTSMKYEAPQQLTIGETLGSWAPQMSHKDLKRALGRDFSAYLAASRLSYQQVVMHFNALSSGAVMFDEHMLHKVCEGAFINPRDADALADFMESWHFSAGLHQTMRQTIGTPAYEDQ